MGTTSSASQVYRFGDATQIAGDQISTSNALIRVVGKSGTATLIGNLPANTGGKYTVLLTASDSGRSVSQDLFLHRQCTITCA